MITTNDHVFCTHQKLIERKQHQKFITNKKIGAGAPEVNEKSTPAPTTSSNGEEVKSFPTALIATASIVSGIIVITSLLIYFKKRK